MNERTENIGARRLHTIMEKLLEEISFTAPDLGEQEITITDEYVRERLANSDRRRGFEPVYFIAVSGQLSAVS